MPKLRNKTDENTCAPFIAVFGGRQACTARPRRKTARERQRVMWSNCIL